MKKSSVLVAALAALLVVASLLAACAKATPTPPPAPAPTPTPAPQKITWKLFTALPVTHDVTKTYQVFADEVSRRTNGQLEITVYPAGELPYRGTETLSIIKQGFVDIAEIIPPFVAGESPILNLNALPFLGLDQEQYKMVTDMSVPYWDKELERFNAKRLDLFNWPPQQVWSARDISSIDQLKGIKLRVYTDVHADMAKAWGATPVTLVTAEVPTALQRGTVDAVITAAFNLVSVKWDQFIKTVLKMDLLVGVPDFTVVNLDSLNALPADVRATLLEVGQENSARFDELMSSLEAKNMQTVRDEGIKVYEIPVAVRKEQQKLAVPIWDAWAERSGPEATELMQKLKPALGQ